MFVLHVLPTDIQLRAAIECRTSVITWWLRVLVGKFGQLLKNCNQTPLVAMTQIDLFIKFHWEPQWMTETDEISSNDYIINCASGHAHFWHCFTAGPSVGTCCYHLFKIHNRCFVRPCFLHSFNELRWKQYKVDRINWIPSASRENHTYTPDYHKGSGPVNWSANALHKSLGAASC